MAIWIGKAIREYTNPANWNPANVPDSAGETATFTNNGAPTAVTINNQTVSLGGFTFDAGAPTYTIRLFTPGGPQSLQFVGAGIVNNSGVAQNLSTGIFNGINFLASSTAGNATITVNTGAHLKFFDTSSGGTARIINGGFVGLDDQLRGSQHRLPGGQWNCPGRHRGRRRGNPDAHRRQPEHQHDVFRHPRKTYMPLSA